MIYDLEYTAGCVQVICKFYAILSKRLKHLQILASGGFLEPHPWIPKGSCTVLTPGQNVAALSQLGLPSARAFSRKCSQQVQPCSTTHLQLHPHGALSPWTLLNS